MLRGGVKTDWHPLVTARLLHVAPAPALRNSWWTIVAGPAGYAAGEAEERTGFDAWPGRLAEAVEAAFTWYYYAYGFLGWR